MKIDYQTHYDADYFTGRKPYVAPDGSVKTYQGPSLTWDGFDAVASALRLVVPGKTLLDVGCSAGDLAQRMGRRGFDAYGVDVSEYAVAHCAPGMKGKLAVADITTIPTSLHAYHGGATLPKTYDTVIATDLLEHIYEEDLPMTLEWIVARAERWIFLLVATAAFDKEVFVARKGLPIPREMEYTAVAGHVNVRTWQYWVKLFREKHLDVRYDLMYLFQMLREKDAEWRNNLGWNMACTFILETGRF